MEVIVTEKKCCRCGFVKPLGSFHVRRGNKSHSWCKACVSEYNKGRQSEYRRTHREQIRDYQRVYGRKYHLEQKFGLTSDEYGSMLAAQGGVCAICGATNPGGRGLNFHVDHDHNTGKVRGLLCSRCNLAVGLFDDNASIMQSAVTYLVKV